MVVLRVFKWILFLTFCFHFFDTVHGKDSLEHRKQYGRGKYSARRYPSADYKFKAWIKEYDPDKNTVTLKWKPPVKFDILIWQRVRILDENNTKVWNDVLTGLATESIVFGLKFGSQYRARIRTYANIGRTYTSRRILIQLNECTACHPKYGKCSDGINCVCADGWEGKLCGQCRRKPGCVHGACEKPGECICHPGWVGDLCSSAIDAVTPPVITDILKPDPLLNKLVYDVNITWEETMINTSGVTNFIYVNKTLDTSYSRRGVTIYNTTGVNSLQVQLWLSTVYDIRMQTARGDNYSRASRPTIFSTYYGFPISMKPQNIIPIMTEARKVTMIWDPPKNYLYGVIGYAIRHKQKCHKRGRDVEVVIGNRTSYTFKKLLPFCKYKFKFAAINAYARAGNFEFNHCTLPESVQAPRHLSVKFVTRSQIKLKWNDPQPNDRDCNFQKTFTVLMNGTTVVHVSRSEFSDLTLEPNRKYMFQVRKDYSIRCDSPGPHYGKTLGNVSSPYSEVITVTTNGINSA